MVSDRRVNYVSQVKPAVNTVIAQAGYFEKSIAGGREIHDPVYRICTLLFIYHVNHDACNAWKMPGHKAGVNPLLNSFCSCLVISNNHVPPK
jgi:hypothetical protein